MSRLLVVEHQSDCSAARLGTWLEAAGVELEVVRPYLGDGVPDAVLQDGLVVLGGAMASWDDTSVPWLPQTRALLAGAVAESVPVLAICLGAQLLAAACGGRVEVGRRGIEAGVADVRLRSEAATDPLLLAGRAHRVDPGRLPGPSMHLDAVVELPPGAVWLAETDLYPHQAFRLGACAWGLQYHPEVGPEGFARWAAGHRNDWPRWRMEEERVVGSLRAVDDLVVAEGRALARAFAAQLDPVSV